MTTNGAVTFYENTADEIWHKYGLTDEMSHDEGWTMFTTSEGRLEIQRIDDLEKLSDDDQAILHVYARASKDDSPIHRLALILEGRGFDQLVRVPRSLLDDAYNQRVASLEATRTQKDHLVAIYADLLQAARDVVANSPTLHKYHLSCPHVLKLANVIDRLDAQPCHHTERGPFDNKEIRSLLEGARIAMTEAKIMFKDIETLIGEPDGVPALLDKSLKQIACVKQGASRG